MLSPIYGQLSPLRVPARVASGPDADALAYIAAVEAADGQSLEEGVATAFTDFIVGCKADGIWSAIKASCILAGARTLSGALVPLVGTAPTNNNFVSGDYDRETGLKGNGSTKYLNSNRAADADPQNNASIAIWVTTPAANVNYYYLGALRTNPNVFSAISTNVGFSLRSAGLGPNTNPTGTGLAGISQTASNSRNWRWAGATGSSNFGTAGTYNGNIFVYGMNLNGAISNRSNGRLAFYSIGEAINLALLDTRVSTLMTDLAAAI